MNEPTSPLAVDAAEIPPRTSATRYPAQFASLVAGREKRALAERFGVKAFGVNLTRLAPGSQSAFRHRHTRQEEFLYVLEGEPTLVTDHGETLLRPGMCAGFTPGLLAHHLVNRSSRDVLYLEVGDRPEGDEAMYPHDDIKAVRAADGTSHFAHKDGSPY